MTDEQTAWNVQSNAQGLIAVEQCNRCKQVFKEHKEVKWIQVFGECGQCSNGGEL